MLCKPFFNPPQSSMMVFNISHSYVWMIFVCVCVFYHWSFTSNHNSLQIWSFVNLCICEEKAWYNFPLGVWTQIIFMKNKNNITIKSNEFSFPLCPFFSTQQKSSRKKITKICAMWNIKNTNHQTWYIKKD